MDRILVLRGGALGDFIVTLPTLAALRRRWPEARIELAGNPTAARLALNRGLLDAVHSQHEARWSALFSADALPGELAGWLGSFDLVLSYWPDAEGALARHFPGRAGQIFLSAAAHPTRGPAAMHYAQPLRALGIDLPPENFSYRLSPALKPRFAAETDAGQVLDANGPAGGRPRIALHPGSGSPRKNWPIERWVELGGWLQASHGADLILIAGDAETSATRQALAPLGRELHSLSLEELVGELTQCQWFIGHDSGISHLAAACGVPSLLLFGPTDPAIWAPPAKHVHVLRKGPTLADISVSDVQAAWSRRL